MIQPRDLIVETKIKGVDIIPGNIALAGGELKLMEMPQWDRSIKEGLQGIYSRYDFALIDTAPSFGLWS